MSFYQVFDFLRDLNKNNNKAWMDEHRGRYHEVRDFMLGWIENLDKRLQEIDLGYMPTPAKKAISRINNNLVYKPNAPTYRDHFGAEMNKAKDKSGFYVHMSLNGSFIGGGFYNPSKDQLDSIRDAIDYNGEELKKIISKKSFVETFGEMSDKDALKTAPKGFAQDHKHIDLLRMKSFAVMHTITQKEIMADNFTDKVVKVYQEIVPFNQYLEKAVSV
ncbi:DUF2461 domain-containing protein [Tunicatimonas pelagia]|uniref:DUF2461 domain-containing protein n=1 Tax=Tunicatimonas pelagia TaxID=931531 RepID=UPI00266522E4|nr:DUF2461 domain-containing protein [Tunicatimonas pelagia]WKN45641.1 DUF2461 domain-containing protein [Tunicatimonas pelagia]